LLVSFVVRTSAERPSLPDGSVPADGAHSEHEHQADGSDSLITISAGRSRRCTTKASCGETRRCTEASPPHGGLCPGTPRLGASPRWPYSCSGALETAVSKARTESGREVPRRSLAGGDQTEPARWGFTVIPIRLMLLAVICPGRTCANYSSPPASASSRAGPSKPRRGDRTGRGTQRDRHARRRDPGRRRGNLGVSFRTRDRANRGAGARSRRFWRSKPLGCHWSAAG
jgi:hypothetical protein